MRDREGELLQVVIRVNEFLLDFLAGGNVVIHTRESNRLSVYIAKHGPLSGKPVHGSVGPYDPKFIVEGKCFAQGSLHLDVDSLAIVRMHEIDPFLIGNRRMIVRKSVKREILTGKGGK